MGEFICTEVLVFRSKNLPARCFWKWASFNKQAKPLRNSLASPVFTSFSCYFNQNRKRKGLLWPIISDEQMPGFLSHVLPYLSSDDLPFFPFFCVWNRRVVCCDWIPNDERTVSLLSLMINYLYIFALIFGRVARKLD